MPTSRMVVPEGLTHRAVILHSPRIVLWPGTVRERLATQWYSSGYACPRLLQEGPDRAAAVQHRVPLE